MSELWSPWGAAGSLALLALLGCGNVVRDEWSLRAGPRAWDTDRPPLPMVLLVVVSDAPGTLAAHEGLVAGLERLVRRLVVPPCGGDLERAGPYESCPPDALSVARAVTPLRVGVVSAGLAVPGTGLCAEEPERANGHLQVRGAGGVRVSSASPAGWLTFDGRAWTRDAFGAALDAYVRDVREVVLGLGEAGCPVQAPLEAEFRLLHDPDPRLVGSAEPDAVILAARAEALATRGWLVTVTHSDRDDCSVAGPAAADELAAAVGGAADAWSATGLCLERAASLHPTSRYASAIQICSRAEDARDVGAQAADCWQGASRILLGGVPSVDLPDVQAPRELGFRGFWGLALGSDVEPPADPFMVESLLPRVAAAPHPLTGELPLTTAEAVAAGAFTLNGHEHSRSDAVQLACRQQLAAPRPCDDAELACLCARGEVGDDPRCEPVPGSGERVQHGVGAAPSRRLLSLLREQERFEEWVFPFVDSYCEEPGDYGFEAFRALAALLEAGYHGCPGVDLAPEPGCLVLEASRPTGECRCEARGLRRHQDPRLLEEAAPHLACYAGEECPAPCLCELEPLTGAARELCRHSDAPYLLDPATGEPLRGWCVLDEGSDFIAQGNCPERFQGLFRVPADPETPPSFVRYLIRCRK